MSRPKILVLGGAASGKSEFAEELVCSFGPERLYLASAEAYDAEMEAKIQIHQDRRGDGWQVSEDPLELGPALGGSLPVLFDCATMWLSNHLMAGSDLAAAQDRLLADIAAQTGFAQQSHMTQQFKRHTGLTPAAYRRLVSA